MSKRVTILFLLALAAVVAMVFFACAPKGNPGQLNHCPMHPTYIADKPGDCPICGMRLVPIENKTETKKAALFICPMHPEVTSDSPGKCPICGMDLVPVTPAPGAATQGAPHAEHSPDAATGVSGMATVALTPEQVRLAGVQTAPATKEGLARVIRAVGTVKPNETRVRHIHAKISGWVDKLYVNFMGQPVSQGQIVLTIYSPELLATQQEYLQARDSARKFSKSTLPEVQRGAEDLVKAARRRLELFDVPESFFEKLDRTGIPEKSVPLVSPASGFVTARDTYEGQRIEPDTDLFTITDLSQVWVEASLYEYEAQLVRVGQQASLALPYEPGVELKAAVTFINPFLDPASRTVGVRLELPNPGLRLKPDMFTNVEFQVEPREGIVVPDSAVMDTGQRQVVFVEVSPDTFEPREVSGVVRSGGRAQILSGVREGERVVVGANFLLDSESRLQAALRSSVETSSGGPAAGTPPAGGTPPAHQH